MARALRALDRRMLLFTHPSMLATSRRPVTPSTPAACKPCSTRWRTCRSIAAKRRSRDASALERVHPQRYIDALEPAFAEARDARVRLDPDTYISAGSREAIYRAAGACVAAVDAVMAAKTTWRSAPCVRPAITPSRRRRWAFAFSTTSPSARCTRSTRTASARVAVVDFDVHHGNGTQTVAEREPRLMFASTHQAPLYPGTGAASETGVRRQRRQRAAAAGAGSAQWRQAMQTRVLPALDAFAPELILVSAGFRRAQGRSARANGTGRRGFRLGGARTARAIAYNTARASLSQLWRAGTTWLRSPDRPRLIWGRFSAIETRSRGGGSPVARRVRMTTTMAPDETLDRRSAATHRLDCHRAARPAACRPHRPHRPSRLSRVVDRLTICAGLHPE